MQIKGVFYNTAYNLSVQAVSGNHKSDYETTSVIPITNSSDHLKLKPTFLKWDNGRLVYEIPKRNTILSEYLIAVVQTEYKLINTNYHKYCANANESVWTAKSVEVLLLFIQGFCFVIFYFSCWIESKLCILEMGVRVLFRTKTKVALLQTSRCPQNTFI